MMNSTYVPMDETLTRKRKQEITSISDYVYSSPNSPTSHPLNLSTDLMEHTGYNFGLEPLMTTTAATATTVAATTPTTTIPFDYNNSMNDYHQSSLQQHHYQQQQQQQHHDHFNGFNPRRHSVAIGDMDYHTFNHTNDFVKQEPLTNVSWNTDLQQFLGDASLPSSFSSHSSSHTLNRLDLHHNQQQQIYHHQQPIPHQRAMSLRLENTSSPSPHDYSNATASPTTPVFFSPQFLDSLSSTTEEDGNSLNHSFMDSTSTSTSSISFNSNSNNNSNNNNGNYHPTTPLHHPFSNSVANHHLPSDFMVNPGQLAMQPPTQSSSTSSWTMDSSSSPPSSTNLIPSTSTSSIKKSFSSRRRSSNKSIKESPPSSPSHTMSTCSPSPPITPSQHTNINNSNNYDSSNSTTFQHTHPSIPEEDDDFMENRHHGNKNSNNNHNEEDDASSSSSSSTLSSAEHRAAAERRAKNSLITARIIQGANTANQLKPYIQQYLLSNDAIPSGERTITILTSKVAQKSYGTEKRFLCPPPTTILSGSSWWTNKDTNEEDINDQQQQNNYYSNIPSPLPSLSQPKLNVHISGEATSQNGVLEWSLENGTIIDNSTALISAAHASKAGEMAISGKCVSKQLHINDADEKRRRVEVLVKMQLGNGLNFGTLPSKGIKVISKPSKKRQSVKNMELCIHHGTTISLFNRIRSQTVSTKYLGVSSNQPENNNNGTVPSTNNNGNNGTCFVARTSSWDPFVIWIVDTSQSPEAASATPPCMPHHPIHPDFPPPPAIAMQSGLNVQSPVAIHYNQPVVLQCVSTGLVSPVMVIRKVDKGSMVLGGNRVEDLSGLTGGECGDEALGDPVSQLHKIAFQIVQDPSVAYHNKANYQPHLTSLVSTSTEWQVPQSSGHPVTYLACLNDVVGMHKTSTMRTFVSSKPPISPSLTAVSSTSSTTTHSLWGDMFPDDMMTSVISSQEPTGKVVRKRRVSCDVVKPVSLPPKIAPPYTNQHHHLQHHGKNSASQRRRVNSLNDVPIKVNAEGGSGGRRNSTLSDRRNSISSDNGNPVDGACWTEDVSDAAVWTIVGTDSAKYTFWIPPTNSLSSSSSFYQDQQQQPFNNPFDEPEQSHPITPFPVVGHISPSSNTMLITGENMTRDLSVWFGDIKAPLTEYKSRELISCTLPDNHDLCSSMVATSDNDCNKLKKLPILLVRGDGVVYRTGQFFTF